MTDSHAAALAYLKQLDREQRERYRPQPERQPQRTAGLPVVSVPALEPRPLARADVAAAHHMVAAINRMQAEGSMSTPLLRGDR